MRDLARRLAKLEVSGASGHKPPDPVLAATSLMQTALVAVWCGDLQPHESLAEAHARALGYDSYQHYSADLRETDNDWLDRHDRAWRDLLAEHGVSPSSSIDTIGAVLEHLLERVPTGVRDRIEEKFAAARA